jgi:hypothetical protein
MKAAILEVLGALSRIDRDGRAIHDRLESMPARFAKIEAEVARQRADVARLERELDEAGKKRRDLEQEVLALVAQMGNDAAKLNVIRNNIEYQAMLKQIAEAKLKKTALENEALALMEREEELGRRLKAEQARAEREIADLAGEKRTLEEEQKRHQSELAAKNAERSRLLGDLEPELRARYERMARAKHGLAVVPVVKGACGGCFAALPPQRVNEARLAERLVFCDACSRILVWDEESGSL